MTIRNITADTVDLAMREADQLGRQPFLERYGFRFANTYLLRHQGRFYDPKALAGVAHGFLDGEQPLAANEFDATEAIARLRQLGLDIVNFSALWWVNQGSTYAAERMGGYVWAPKLTKAGRPASHHVAVSELRPGQMLVHYKDGAVRAIGRVSGQPRSVAKPAELNTDAWGVDGYGCPVTYTDVRPPIPRQEIPNRTSEVGPFDIKGGVKQGYLYRVSNAQLFPLLEFLDARVPDLFSSSDLVNTSPFVLERDMDDSPIHDLLHSAKNIVLEGVPGTGKSFAIERLAREWKDRTGRELVSFDDKPFVAIVMHPSSSYEDFVEGLRPQATGSSPALFDVPPESTGGDFRIDDGFFVRVCALAVREPSKDVLVLVDELNRCNVASVLGDLLLTVEASRRARFQGDPNGSSSAADWSTAVHVRLPYSGRRFFVPDNVYIVATTNTTDRSVAPLDAAIRRRFAFYRIEPDLAGPVIVAQQTLGPDAPLVVESANVLRDLNDLVLAMCLGPDAMLGPSYLYALVDQVGAGAGQSAVARMWRFSVVPQLIDVLRSYGAEALLDRKTRDEWFAEHGTEIATDVDSARNVLETLDTYLAALGMRLVVDGTGLGRGARVVDPTKARLDIASPLSAIAVDDLRVEEYSPGAATAEEPTPTPRPQ